MFARATAVFLQKQHVVPALSRQPRRMVVSLEIAAEIPIVDRLHLVLKAVLVLKKQEQAIAIVGEIQSRL